MIRMHTLNTFGALVSMVTSLSENSFVSFSMMLFSACLIFSETSSGWFNICSGNLMSEVFPPRSPGSVTILARTNAVDLGRILGWRRLARAAVGEGRLPLALHSAFCRQRWVTSPASALPLPRRHPRTAASPSSCSCCFRASWASTTTSWLTSAFSRGGPRARAMPRDRRQRSPWRRPLAMTPSRSRVRCLRTYCDVSCGRRMQRTSSGA